MVIYPNIIENCRNFHKKGGIIMVKKKTRRERVTFTATKKVPKKVDVSFSTSSGEEVSFRATKKVPKKVKVDFLAKRKKRK